MLPAVSESLPFFTRIVLAIRCYFRVLFDARVAARVQRALSGEPVSPEAHPELPAPKPGLEKRDPQGALALLALFQREGRLVDFLQQDVTSFSDADVGAAARVVHAGCRKALGAHAEIEPIYSEDEGTTLTLEAGFDRERVKLTGNVGGTPPFRGALRHRGWRVKRLDLPSSIQGHDARVLAPAEVEL